MAVRLRLTRVGGRKDPIWRVVVADQRSPRDGRFIETVGQYNPQTEPSTIVLDEERVRAWLAKGAQPSQHRPQAAADAGHRPQRAVARMREPARVPRPQAGRRARRGRPSSSSRRTTARSCSSSSVAEDDYGQVIGRGGRTANALRTVVKAAAVKENRRVLVDIVD